MITADDVRADTVLVLLVLLLLMIVARFEDLQGLGVAQGRG